ncbi:RNA polymerase sigma-70 factor, ECF subfamily [Paenibacillus tianmuensis]|uniref:RNA polymerase sigma-70 factor, ECF subfamily n=1 Tax=Paenibacillus tianmuensis TaxID=624147 RepID=A0A1G4RFV0_9BACL|nr:RNA polymerase sigma-70 factor, ECF subfamily [Paenibacillus tianmuensis]
MVEEREIRQESERELIHRIVAGSKQEFCFLVDRYKQKVYGLLRGMGASPMDAAACYSR